MCGIYKKMNFYRKFLKYFLLSCGFASGMQPGGTLSGRTFLHLRCKKKNPPPRHIPPQNVGKCTSPLHIDGTRSEGENLKMRIRRGRSHRGPAFLRLYPGRPCPPHITRDVHFLAYNAAVKCAGLDLTRYFF